MQVCTLESLGGKELRVDDRVNEFVKRQVWYGSSVTVKLHAIDGLFYYRVFGWINNCKFTIIDSTKYHGEDPEELILSALKELKIQKIKCGVPITMGGKGL